MTNARGKLNSTIPNTFPTLRPTTLFAFPMSQETLDLFGDTAFQIHSGRSSIVVASESDGFVYKHHIAKIESI